MHTSTDGQPENIMHLAPSTGWVKAHKSKLDENLLPFFLQMFILHAQLILDTFIDVNHHLITIHLQRICTR